MNKLIITLATSFVTFFAGISAYDGRVVEYNLVDGLPNIYLTAQSENIGCTWSHGNIHDKPLIRKFYEMLNSHEGHFVVLDVGAQTGCFSLLSKYFPDSEWYSFEPIPVVADNLKMNLELNGIGNVQVATKAASKEAGTATIYLPNMNDWGLATLGSNVLRFNPTGEQTIECIDLDTFITENQIPKVDYMKIDTEGWELNVLLGARNMILRDKPIILMEYNETNMAQCHVVKEQINAFLTEMGYNWSLVSSEDILCVPCEPITVISPYLSLDIAALINDYLNNHQYNVATDLCSIMTDHGSDKGCYHNYTTLYYALFSQYKDEALNIFELGLGTNNTDVPSNMGSGGIPGASLLGWADYFPHAKIFGADIDDRILFQTPRISTFYCDQRDEKCIDDMFTNDTLKGMLFDIIIEDGLHEFDANLTFLLTSIKYLKKGGIYITEDLHVATEAKFNKLLPYLRKEFAYAEVIRIPTDQPGPLLYRDNALLVIQK